MELRRYEIAVLMPLERRRRKQTINYYRVGALSREDALRAMADDMADVAGLPNRRGEILGCFENGTFARVVFHGARNVTAEEAANLRAKWAARSAQEAAQ